MEKTKKEIAQEEIAGAVSYRDNPGYVLIIKPRIVQMRDEVIEDILSNDTISAEQRENKRHYLRALLDILELPDVVERNATNTIIG